MSLQSLFYKILIQLTKILGPWIFVFFSQCIAFGYFIFFPNRVLTGIRFYRAVFPGHSRLYYLRCTWKQYQNFTSLFLDRFLYQDFNQITCTTEGLEHLETLTEQSGGIILMSHMGNWEIAARLLRQKLKGMPLLLYMSARNKAEIEQMQQDALLESGVKIIAVSPETSSPLDIVEGIQFLKSGHIVSMAGDVIWKNDQRQILVKFLNHQAFLPETPHVLALLSNTPIFVFFAFRTGKGNYHFSLSKQIVLEKTSRAERNQTIQKSAQKYADMLEQAVLAHPFEWYHFEPFIQKKPNP